MAPSGNQPALTGSLSTLSLIGVVQILAAERRTGRLDVVANASRGGLWLANGKLVHALARSTAKGEVTGEVALDRLAALDDGRFEFHEGADAPERTLAGSTDHLLMEAAYRRDSHRRAETEGVPLAAVPAFAPVPDGGDAPRFTTLQWRVLASIDGAKDVATLARECEMPEAAMSRLVGDLVALGVVRLA